MGALDALLTQLEVLGEQNDAQQTQHSEKYLNITRDTGAFLSVLVKSIQAQTILEVGTSNGYSTLWLVSALPDHGRVTTIEHSSRKAQEARAHFEQVGLSERIELLEGDALEQLHQLQGLFDLVFLDADRGQYLAMADAVWARLKPGGLLVCDNAISHQQQLAPFREWVQARTDTSEALVPVGKGELMVYKALT
ncbi:methyltransferase [Terasakiispira papahanaumokuakeensis]|uniref:Methyltransferase n=1 Tax=Terasakiispira papahanaumokuakeensis TaxID=197479 RepID=A0A1E2V6M6_9GAMM|nr:O-methyltransferase [Terasakiispira papahanaumokuakeensis]ODC02649.1 methyltransferase [Terasakiispira papahanaumokuakeensis]